MFYFQTEFSGILLEQAESKSVSFLCYTGERKKDRSINYDYDNLV